MADSKSWFPKSLKKGKIIKLTEPVSSRWKIVEKVNEHVEQYEDTELHPSLASAKFLCRDASSPSNKKDVYLRIVQQIPSVKGEVSDHADREATEFTPPELKAYQTLKERKSPNTPKLLAWQQEIQDTSGPVPGGWITWIVFERVEGFPLGDEYGAGAFWEQSPDTQMTIRRVLVEEFSLAAKIGVLPADEGPYSAIWNDKTQTIHFVGFRDPEFFEAELPVAPDVVFQIFDIHEPPLTRETDPYFVMLRTGVIPGSDL